MAFTLRSDEGDDGGRLGRRSWVQAGAAGRRGHRGSGDVEKHSTMVSNFFHSLSHRLPYD